MLTREQLELRKTGIGGSDIAAVIGENPWSSPLDVYLDKKGLVPRKELTPAMECGQFFEPGILSIYERRKNRIVTPCETLRYPNSIIFATPDGQTVDDTGARVGLEVKLPARTAHHWGEAGTDQIPKYYLAQTQFEAAVLCASSVDVAAYRYGDVSIYTVPFNSRLFDALRHAAERFWRDHVLADKPPPADSSERTREWLEKTYPRALSPRIEITQEIEELARAYAAAREAEALAKSDKDSARNQLAAILRHCDGAYNNLISITYRNNKDGTKIDYDELIKEIPESMIQKYTKIVAGKRVMRVTVRE